MGNQGGSFSGNQMAHKRQFSSNAAQKISGQQFAGRQINRNGIQGMNLYEKRGRNQKGQIMFYHLPGASGAGTADAQGKFHGATTTGHQRNKTQIIGQNGEQQQYLYT
mmetsp:Transcript_1801/g.2381  ORF Transcript_1801/g.2381 Transcript_1801/m.2381 type:complete len:108 (+) Transcript_1801:1868-2191(+)